MRAFAALYEEICPSNDNVLSIHLSSKLSRTVAHARLGTEEVPPISQHFIARLGPGDTLIACSDGIWHYFSPNEMGSALFMLSPREATEFLIQKARSRANGGGDNLSLVIVKLEALD